MNIDSWLAELKVPREAYRVVMLRPLIYVAWADGKRHKAERLLLLNIAQDKGLLENGGDSALERWLTEPPSRSRFGARRIRTRRAEDDRCGAGRKRRKELAGYTRAIARLVNKRLARCSAFFTTVDP